MFLLSHISHLHSWMRLRWLFTFHHIKSPHLGEYVLSTCSKHLGRHSDGRKFLNQIQVPFPIASHVWYNHLHLPYKSSKCQEIYQSHGSVMGQDFDSSSLRFIISRFCRNLGTLDVNISIEQTQRSPQSSLIQVMQPKYLAFRTWLDPPQSSSSDVRYGDWICIGPV